MMRRQHMMSRSSTEAPGSTIRNPGGPHEKCPHKSCPHKRSFARATYAAVLCALGASSACAGDHTLPDARSGGGPSETLTTAGTSQSAPPSSGVEDELGREEGGRVADPDCRVLSGNESTLASLDRSTEDAVPYDWQLQSTSTRWDCEQEMLMLELREGDCESASRSRLFQLSLPLENINTVVNPGQYYVLPPPFDNRVSVRVVDEAGRIYGNCVDTGEDSFFEFSDMGDGTGQVWAGDVSLQLTTCDADEPFAYEVSGRFELPITRGYTEVCPD